MRTRAQRRLQSKRQPHAERPNALKLRGLLAGLASGSAARVESQAWNQLRDAAIALDLWIIE
jgi:hypothetical protein